MKPEELHQELENIFADFSGTEDDLIPVLQKIQTRFNYLPSIALSEAAAFLNVPECKVYGVVTFYSQFHLKPQGKNKIKICEGTACHVRGSKKLTDAVHKKIGLRPGETSEDGEFSVERVACIGSCALAPAIINNDKIHGPMSPEILEDLIEQTLNGNTD